MSSLDTTPDARVYCKTCGQVRDHMHLDRAVCICSTCGDTNQVKDHKRMIENIAKRRAASQAAIARSNYIKTDKIKTKETIMPKAKFTMEDIEDIKREKKEGATEKDIAMRRNCSVGTIYQMLTKKPKRVAPSTNETADKSDTNRGGGKKPKADPVPQSGGFKQAITQLVTDQVDARFAEFDLDAKVEEILGRFLK